jgi:hypothetical protein
MGSVVNFCQCNGSRSETCSGPTEGFFLGNHLFVNRATMSKLMTSSYVTWRELSFWTNTTFTFLLRNCLFSFTNDKYKLMNKKFVCHFGFTWSDDFMQCMSCSFVSKQNIPPMMRQHDTLVYAFSRFRDIIYCIVYMHTMKSFVQYVTV